MMFFIVKLVRADQPPIIMQFKLNTSALRRAVAAFFVIAPLFLGQCISATSGQSNNPDQELLDSVNQYLVERANAWNGGDIDGFLEPFEGDDRVIALDSTERDASALMDRYKEIAGDLKREASEGGGDESQPRYQFNEIDADVAQQLGRLAFGPARITKVGQTDFITANYLLSRNQADLSGELIIGIRKDNEDWSISADMTSLGKDIILEKPPANFGWLSVIPPLLAIFLAIVTRRVLVSLFFGIIVGCGMLAGMDGVMTLQEIWFWLVDTLNILCETFLWPILIENDKQRILWFVILMGAMVGVIHRSGGMHGIVDKLTPFTRTRIGGQFVSWMLGLIIFFDDYANTLLLGNTMRPVTDRVRISREKLAYIVDSTAAPVAGLAIISTWVAMLISQVDIGFQDVNRDLTDKIDYNQFTLVVQSIPYRFYVIFAIIFVVMIAVSGRDFGPMLNAERRALDGYLPDDNAELDDERDLPSRRWFNAVIPIVVLVSATVLFLMTTGRQAAIADKAELTFFNIFSRGDSYVALVYASLLGLATALLLCAGQKLMNPGKMFDSAWSGIKTVIPAMAILWLAWTLSALTSSENLGTQDYLAALLTVEEQPEWCPTWLFIVYGNITSVVWLPTAIFILSGFVAFATGSSWGTMGIMAPLVIKVTYELTTLQLGDCPPDHPLMLSAIGSVIAGSIFGDHCSPISDTTVLSSQASSCNHIAHVRTQMPYAILVGIVTILFGTLPVGILSFYDWNISPGVVLAITLSLGVVSMLCFLLIFGRRPQVGQVLPATPVSKEPR